MDEFEYEEYTIEQATTMMQLPRNVDSSWLIHDSDRKSMTALKAIPGFAQLLNAYMRVWSDNTFHLISMSTKIRLGENQMAEIYNMLPPICDKLGIEVPELYLELDVNPNAYTYGVSKPYIILTSGLLESFPKRLIPTVLAHECGHIACQHTLFNTLGTAVLSGASTFVSGLGNLALYPLEMAFAYWMRCSDYSADRAAIICEGTANNVVEMCMRFAGYTRKIPVEANLNEFVQQAKEFREIINDSNYNKTLEFLLFRKSGNPLNSVRAYEAARWIKSKRYNNIVDYLNSPPGMADENMLIPVNVKKLLGSKTADAHLLLMSLGFTNIAVASSCNCPGKAREGDVIGVKVDGIEVVKEGYFKKGSQFLLTYYESAVEHTVMQHVEDVFVPEGFKYYVGREVHDVLDELRDYGFTNVIARDMPLPKRGKYNENTVAMVVIDGDNKFAKKSWHSQDAEVVVFYYLRESNESTSLRSAKLDDLE